MLRETLLLLQLLNESQAAQQVQQQREGEAAAAAALTDGAQQAREHSQQAMRWVSAHIDLPSVKNSAVCLCSGVLHTWILA